MKTISFLVPTIGIAALVAVIAPLALVSSQQQYVFAANDLDKVIKSANEGKDETIFSCFTIRLSSHRVISEKWKDMNIVLASLTLAAVITLLSECVRIARLAGNESAQVNRIVDVFSKYRMR